jgi:hypothetical protein
VDDLHRDLERHQSCVHEDPVCRYCQQDFPCDAARALAALTAAESEKAALVEAGRQFSEAADDHFHYCESDDWAFSEAMQSFDALLANLTPAAKARDAALIAKAVEAERERLRPLSAALGFIAVRTIGGMPCWCISEDAPHEGWQHSPTCTLIGDVRALLRQDRGDE